MKKCTLCVDRIDNAAASRDRPHPRLRPHLPDRRPPLRRPRRPREPRLPPRRRPRRHRPHARAGHPPDQQVPAPARPRHRHPRPPPRPAARRREGGFLGWLDRTLARLWMHPAPSIIAFTTLSGLGFGLMAWLGIGAEPLAPLTPSSLSALAVALAAAGLLASLLHLGQPRRFLKAFSQWRSSWLSREAVLAVATLAAFALFAALWVLFGIRTRWLGLPAAALALATVVATAMIYAQLRSVPRWHSPLTPAPLPALRPRRRRAPRRRRRPGPLAPRGPRPRPARRLGSTATAASRRSGTTLATATGLGALGRLRLLEPPHTGANYLLREMVYVVGRRHALKLRALGLAPRRRCCRSRLALAPPPRSRSPLAALAHVARRAGPALALLRGGRARGWTLLRKALRHRPPARRSAPRHAEGQAQAQPRRGILAGPAAAAAGGGALLAALGQGAAHPAHHQPRHRALGDPQGLADAQPHRGRGGRPRGLRGGRAARHRRRPQHRPLHLPEGAGAGPAASPARCGSSRSRRARCSQASPRPASAGPSGSRRTRPPAGWPSPSSPR